MNTVLIVEDEKMIRQGLRAMVQRSGVPVGTILECGNGELALEILSEQVVDVMFTDIRMPKMDGIELVKRVHTLPNKPLIVAVSGYDDFSFAVEMLRNGVRDYLLKPVERQQVIKILQQCEEEIQARKQEKAADLRIGKSQIRRLLEGAAKEEEQFILEQYGKTFFPEGYVICVSGKDFFAEENQSVLFFDDLPELNLCISAPEYFEETLKKELWKEYAGVSRCYESLADLRKAYQEAFAARKRAFYKGEALVEDSTPVHIPEKLRQESLKTISESAWTGRVHLIGTDREADMEMSWKQLYFEAERERITPEEFETGIRGFLEGVLKIYRNSITEEQKLVLDQCRNLYAYANLEEYRNELMAVIYEIHNGLMEKKESSDSQRRIRIAVDYIREHYRENLNMAVVSNYVSMNYSLFSYEIKQYTGKNFVDFLKEIRIEEAKRLLETTELKVIEISQSVGYENEKHFMKTFKKVCGVSPSEYRKLVRS